jgi:hypothetical protein
MSMNVVLVPQRQTQKGVALSWAAMEGVGHHLVFIANRKHSPEELEAADALGGTEDCQVFKLGSEVVSVVDDVSTAGEACYYGVAMVFTDGAVRSARFRALPDGATAESLPLSSRSKGARSAAAARPAPRPASIAAAPGRPASISAAPARPASLAAAPAAPADEDPLEARKRAQREARARLEAERSGAVTEPPPREVAAREAPVTREVPAPVREVPPSVREGPPAGEAPAAAAEEDALEARRRAQREVRARLEGDRGSAAQAAAAAAPRAAAPAPSAEPPPPPSSVPLEETFAARMSGGTQTWDGLRIYWERAAGPLAAYEVLVSDHQLFGDELADALAGRADFTTAVAVAPSVTAVIDNITPREARGWYLVLTRARDGRRAPHPFQVGDAAQSGRAVAPFVNPNRLGELRAEVEELLGQARENLARWRSEQDRGAQREAKRLLSDAQLIFPGHPGAKALEAELGQE